MGQKGDSRDFELGVFVCPRQVTLRKGRCAGIFPHNHFWSLEKKAVLYLNDARGQRRAVYNLEFIKILFTVLS